LKWLGPDSILALMGASYEVPRTPKVSPPALQWATLSDANTCLLDCAPERKCLYERGTSTMKQPETRPSFVF